MNQNEEATPFYVQFVRRGVVLRCPIAQVAYFEACGNYAFVHLTDGTKGSLRITLRRLEFLYGNDVVLLERSHLVFKRQLLQLKRDSYGHYYARLRNDYCVPVGRSKFKKVRGFFPDDGVATRSN